MLPRALVLVVLCSVSCKSKSETAPQQAAPTSEEPSAESSPKVPAPVLAEADVLAVVNQWLTAQTSGDFATYASVYAERMTGIKRVGNKESRYSRDGWLKDRRRMFKKPMQVTATDLVVQSSLTSAVVRFEQTWASGNFTDVGAKQLILVREGDALRIAREEMLSSAVLSSKQDVPAEDDLLFTAPGLDGFIIGPAEQEWGVGAVELDEAVDPYIAIREASHAKLPDEWKDLVGSSITLYEGGTVCKDTIAALDIVVGVTPHFSFFMDENGQRRASADLAEEIFAMADAYLVARTRGDCTGHVARLGADPRTLPPVERVDVPALESKVLAALRKSSEFKEMQAEYLTYDNDIGGQNKNKGSWVEQEALSVFATGKTHIAVVAVKGGDGCGAFYGSLSAIYELPAKGPAKLVGVLDGFFVPENAIDFDGDGTVEFVGTTSHYGSPEVSFVGRTEDGGEYQLLRSFAWPYHDCPC